MTKDMNIDTNLPSQRVYPMGSIPYEHCPGGCVVHCMPKPQGEHGPTALGHPHHSPRQLLVASRWSCPWALWERAQVTSMTGVEL